MNLIGLPSVAALPLPVNSPAPLGEGPDLPALPVSICSLVVETIDLTGEWIGHYPGHFDEVIRITQQGDSIEAIKITGDEFVPAEAITWRANLQTLEGEGQIAEQEFQNPRFIPGRLLIVNPERIIFRWHNCGEVEFRRDE